MRIGDIVLHNDGNGEHPAIVTHTHGENDYPDVDVVSFDGNSGASGHTSVPHVSNRGEGTVYYRQHHETVD